MKRLFPLTILLSLVVGTALLLGYSKGYWTFNYPSKQTYPIRGIDVSHHQGKIDWSRVKGQGFHFVYLKATEGGDFKDPAFQRNWKEATRAGFIKGAYHYFTFCRPGVEQAKNYIDTVPVESGVLPPAIDVEFVGNCNARPRREDLLKELFDFTREIERVYKKLPVFYVTYETYDLYLTGEFRPYGIWIRDIFGTPRLSDGRRWTFWQFADHGKVEGINGPVDLNVFSDNEQAISRLLTNYGPPKQP